MRLIDADALKDAVKRYAGEPIKKKDGKCQAICLDMLGTIDSQPATSPWHRVEDGLPDLLQFVVVCNDEGKCVVAQYVGYQTDSLTPWRIAYTMYDTDIYDEKECGPVRYWMPLPSPPVNKMFTK